MRYTPTEVDGVMIVDIEPHHDARGFFARSFCADDFESHGLDEAVAQTNISYNRVRGTLRGLHRQIPPYREAKLVRCTRGAIVDVAVDVRPESPTHGRHVKVELTAENHRALFLPPYVAHGFQTLVDDTEVVYQVSGPYAPAGEQGFRYDDEDFGITWPLPVAVISDKDANWPLVAELRSAAR
ncbi:dTDP-4-dehydrorhamnose 3,5-epimerase [Mycobacterium deserti]|uniref:dTDP-4-dehydrorhamnose 3,5-epimerase n=1 Tax=Mycobacterium deserti TaxID=2978347 RepID=A0ABT2MD16_9MYCO|nr:dTDP-4-dehydrorhamnose 3,5-epimerase [Mycobacterium deserti]MCT7660156.1 dTDP-4-dehydrorhamnose 3,5-epimerase [Mycobacterium deserti]